MTFEEANFAVGKALSAKTATKAMSKTGGGPLNQICSAYAIIKPILQLVEAFPLFPKDWKQVIDEFLTTMDKICPAAQGKGTSGASSFEEIDKRVKAALSAHWSTPPKAIVASKGIDLGGIAQEFCAAYKVIKPILDFAQVFVPAAWKAGIVAFETVADAVCNPPSP